MTPKLHQSHVRLAETLWRAGCVYFPQGDQDALPQFDFDPLVPPLSRGPFTQRVTEEVVDVLSHERRTWDLEPLLLCGLPGAGTSIAQALNTALARPSKEACAIFFSLAYEGHPSYAEVVGWPGAFRKVLLVDGTTDDARGHHQRAMNLCLIAGLQVVGLLAIVDNRRNARGLVEDAGGSVLTIFDAADFPKPPQSFFPARP